MGDGTLVRRLRLFSRTDSRLSICESMHSTFYLALYTTGSNMKILAQTTDYYRYNTPVEVSVFINLDTFLDGNIDNALATAFLKRILRNNVKLYIVDDNIVLNLYDSENNWFAVIKRGETIEARLATCGGILDVSSFERISSKLSCAIYNLDYIDKTYPEIAQEARKNIKKRRGSVKTTW